MEQALYITTIDNLRRYWSDDFNRIYFGQEFCQRLLPAPETVRAAGVFARAHAVPLTLVTPYVTDAGLSAVERVLAVYADSGSGTEVVCNDWGVLHLLRRDFAGLEPVLGRLLNKQKRGPRIMNIIDKVPSPTRDYYRRSNLDVPAAVSFLRRQGISRVEFDNLLQGLDFSGADPAVRRSLYLPFAFVSSTRFCLTALADSEADETTVGVLPCSQPCQRYGFTLVNPVMRVPLLRRGNTVFVINDRIPEAVVQGEVDRLVIQPEIPL